MRINLITIMIICLFIFMSEITIGQTEGTFKDIKAYRHTLEISPLSPVFKIYAIQYGYLLSQKNELMLGFAYANIEYDEGRSHAPTLILGYRRFLWKGFHLEYQIWPAYNDYYETTEQKYYNGFELWNEFRSGYQFCFKIHNIPITINPQILCGFGLYPGNKPQSFIKTMEEEPVFIYPNVFMGIKF